MDGKHLLIVEDDQNVAENLKMGLKESGFNVTAVSTAEDALDFLAQTNPDLIILDLGLPGKDGYHVLQHVRAEDSTMPVVILTARDSVDDRVIGLESGADDYIVKPFAFSELLARIRARLRRAETGNASMVIEVGDLRIDVVDRTVARGGQDIELTAREFDLLRYLAANEGESVSREMLARDVWKVQARATPMDNVIDVHMSHLREKIDKGFPTKLIHTVWGVGFVMRSGE